jgi:hypothetical protein
MKSTLEGASGIREKIESKKKELGVQVLFDIDENKSAGEIEDIYKQTLEFLESLSDEEKQRLKEKGEILIEDLSSLKEIVKELRGEEVTAPEIKPKLVTEHPVVEKIYNEIINYCEHSILGEKFSIEDYWTGVKGYNYADFTEEKRKELTEIFENLISSGKFTKRSDGHYALANYQPENIGLPQEKEQKIQQSSPISEPVPEPIPTIQEETIEQKKIPDWRESEEWKKFEDMRDETARYEMEYERLTENSGVQTLGLEKESRKLEYQRYKNEVAKKIKEYLTKEAGENLEPEKEEELQRKIHDTIHKELLENEKESYKKVLKKKKAEALADGADKIKEALRAACETKVMQWYIHLPREKKIALSFILGTTIGIGLGAASSLGVAGYAGMRLSRTAHSFGGTTLGTIIGEKNKNWSIEELNKKEQEEMEILKNSDKSLEEKSRDIEEIGNKYDKLKRSAELKKTALSIGLGAGAGLLAGLSEHIIGGVEKSAAMEQASHPKPKIPEPQPPDLTGKMFDDPSVLVQKSEHGGSIWSALNKTLDHNLRFRNLSGAGTPQEIAEQIEAKQTRILQNLTSEILKNHDQYGVGPNGEIIEGQEINFSKLFENEKLLDKALNDAENLKPVHIASIIENNRKIEGWVEANPGKKVNIDEILKYKPKAISIIEQATVTEAPMEIGPIKPAIPETLVTEEISKSEVSAEQIQGEIEAAKKRLEVLEGGKSGDGLRTMAGDASTQQIVETAFRNEIDSVYGKSGFLGIGKTAGIDTGEWEEMARLPASKVVEYYTGDSAKSGLSADIIERLSKSNSHNALIKQTINLIERSNGAIKPLGGENMEQFFKRLGGYVLRTNLQKAA